MIRDYQTRIHNLRRQYGAGHIPSVDKDIQLEKIQKYLPDPLQHFPRVEMPIEIDNRGNRIISRVSRSHSRSFSPSPSDPAIRDRSSQRSRSLSQYSRAKSRGVQSGDLEVRSNKSNQEC